MQLCQMCLKQPISLILLYHVFHFFLRIFSYFYNKVTNWNSDVFEAGKLKHILQQYILHIIINFFFTWKLLWQVQVSGWLKYIYNSLHIFFKIIIVTTPQLAVYCLFGHKALIQWLSLTILADTQLLKLCCPVGIRLE